MALGHLLVKAIDNLCRLPKAGDNEEGVIRFTRTRAYEKGNTIKEDFGVKKGAYYHAQNSSDAKWEQ